MAAWRWGGLALGIGAVLMVGLFALADANAEGGSPPARSATGELLLPEFPRQTAEAWLNSPPLKAAQLRGQVVLLEVYATG
jgi:hypothetical protein